MEDTILFYSANEEYGEFSNYYMIPIVINDITCKSSEHWYQASKYMGQTSSSIDHEYGRHILNQSTPYKAFMLGKKKKGYRFEWQKVINRIIDQYAEAKIRSDWNTVKDQMMLTAVSTKFHQHPHLQQLLLSTGNKKIGEDSPYDMYWGIRGENKLGEILMILRKQFNKLYIGVIGSSQNVTKIQFEFICQTVKTYYQYYVDNFPNYTPVLVSGGAAGADHAAVSVSLEIGCPLILYLPAPWNKEYKNFENDLANERHMKFHLWGQSSLKELDEIMEKHYVTTHIGKGFLQRNDLLIAKCHYLLAFTSGDLVPNSRGTTYTWNRFSHNDRKKHFTL